MRIINETLLTTKSVNRFWDTVDFNIDGCWEWKDKFTDNGYGKFYTAKLGKVRAHRLAYFLYYRVDPGAMSVCHICDNPKCCNPFHLFLGTAKDNRMDCSRKGRVISHQGMKHYCAKLTDTQVLWIRAQSVAGVSSCEIARQLPVSQVAVYNIINRKTWTHI